MMLSLLDDTLATLLPIAWDERKLKDEIEFNLKQLPNGELAMADRETSSPGDA